MPERFDWGEELRPLLEELERAVERQHPDITKNDRQQALAILVTDLLQAIAAGAVITIVAPGAETRQICLVPVPA